MAYSGGLITGIPSIYDVQRALSSSETDLGKLIANGSINKWARFKPIRDGHERRLDLSERISDKFGLDPGISTTTSSYYLYDKLYSYIYAGNSIFTYLKPRGSANGEWYRLTDFVEDTDSQSYAAISYRHGYNHNAVFPFYSMLGNGSYSSSTVEVNAVAENTITFRCRDNANGEIRMREFLKFNDTVDNNNPWRMVVELIENGDGNWYQRSAPTLRVVGGAISLTSDYDASVTVNINNAAIINSQSSSTIKKFACILGMQRCNDADTTHLAGGFVLPLGKLVNSTPTLLNASLFNLNIASYYAIGATISEVGYGTSGVCDSSGGTWVARSNFSSQRLWVHMKVTSHVNQRMYFAHKNTSTPSGYMKLEIACITSSSSYDSYTVYPSNSSRQQNTSSVLIETRASNMDLYFVSTSFFPSIPSAPPYSFSFQLFMRTKTGSSYSSWVQFGSFGVYYNT